MFRPFDQVPPESAVMAVASKENSDTNMLFYLLIFSWNLMSKEFLKSKNIYLKHLLLKIKYIFLRDSYVCLRWIFIFDSDQAQIKSARFAKYQPNQQRLQFAQINLYRSAVQKKKRWKVQMNSSANFQVKLWHRIRYVCAFLFSFPNRFSKRVSGTTSSSTSLQRLVFYVH